jgi:hypothetical protein
MAENIVADVTINAAADIVAVVSQDGTSVTAICEPPADSNVVAVVETGKGDKGDPGATGPAGATGATGPAGATGATGPTGADGKTVRNGSGTPSAGLGVDGDFYLDTASNLIYGPKTGGAWGTGVVMTGTSYWQCVRPAAGGWIATPGLITVPATATLSSNTVLFVPIQIDTPTSVDALGINIAVGGASRVFRLGLHSANADGSPGARLAYTAEQSAAGSGDIIASITQQDLLPGLYYVSIIQGSAGSNPIWRVTNTGGARLAMAPRATLGGAGNSPPMYIQSHTYTGAATDIPATPAATVSENVGAAPLLMMRRKP